MVGSVSVGVHGIMGWVVLAVVVGAGLHARSRVRSGRAFEATPYRVTGVLVDLQVLVGLGVWAEGRWWDVQGQFLQTWAHPALAIGALVLAHVGIKRARDERWAAEAYGIAGRTLFGVAVLLAGTGAIGLAA